MRLRTLLFPTLTLTTIVAGCRPSEKTTETVEQEQVGGIDTATGSNDSGGDSDDTASNQQDTGPSDPCSDAPKEVTLPADDARHSEALEWWYWTGHIEDEEGSWYGFEQVFFLIDTGASVYTMAHHAITDIGANVFSYAVGWGSGDGDATVTDGFDFALGSLTANGGDGTDVIHGELDNGAVLDLTIADTKGPVLQHCDGYHAYPFGGYTYYYSRTRMNAEGTMIDRDGNKHTVTGTAWFDHQWGALTTASSLGWDWFALQLDDGREIMLFFVRSDDEDTMVGGTLVEVDGSATEIEDITIEATGEWTSDNTKCTYPMGWTMEVADLSLEITPFLSNQEIPNEANTYWEGAAEISGDATGRAYIELTGYCD
jgi:predicted secreted hydrolase